MTRYNEYLYLLIFILLMSMLSNVSGVFNQTLISVNEGDSFVFLVDRLYNSDNDDELYFLGHDTTTLEQHYIKEEAEFTLTFKELEIIGPDEEGNYRISFEITYDNHTFDSTNILNRLSGFIVSTDWKGHRLLLENQVNSFEASFFDIFDIVIIDTSNEFGMIFKYSRSHEEIRLYNEIETRYNKQTGILNYERVYTEYSDGDFTANLESIITRKDWGERLIFNIPKVVKYGTIFVLFVAGAIIVKKRY